MRRVRGSGHFPTPSVRLVLTATLLSLPVMVASFPPDVFEPRYELLQEGDVNIGAIVSLHTWRAGRCSRQTLGMGGVEYLEALLFALRQVNRDGVLKGVTLGVFALDDCFSSSLTLMRAIQFMPRMAESVEPAVLVNDSWGAPRLNSVPEIAHSLFNSSGSADDPGKAPAEYAYEPNRKSAQRSDGIHKRLPDNNSAGARLHGNVSMSGINQNEETSSSVLYPCVPSNTSACRPCCVNCTNCTSACLQPGVTSCRCGAQGHADSDANDIPSNKTCTQSACVIQIPQVKDGRQQKLNTSVSTSSFSSKTEGGSRATQSNVDDFFCCCCVNTCHHRETNETLEPNQTEFTRHSISSGFSTSGRATRSSSSGYENINSSSSRTSSKSDRPSSSSGRTGSSSKSVRASLYNGPGAGLKTSGPSDLLTWNRQTNAGVTDRMPRFFQVAGVLGAYTSQHSIAIARVLQLFNLPLVSPSSTSDELSDKDRFPYFLRTLPSDRDQVQALARVVRHFNWTYVSLVYSADSYGQNGQSKLADMLTSLDVCIALTKTLSATMLASDYDAVITDLRKYKQARVVLLYADVKHVRPLMAAVERNKAYREFIWVGSDAIFNEFQYNPTVCNSSLGSIAVLAHAVTSDEFITHMVNKVHQRLNATKSGSVSSEENLDSWVPDEKEAAEYILAADHLTSSSRPMFAVAAFVIDAVHAFAHAIRDLLQENCPEARGLEARDCVRRHSVYGYLRRVSFQGTSGRFEFDQNGDVVGSIEIRQCQQREGRTSSQLIGMWEHRHANLTIHSAFPDHDVPVSVCARPCELGEIYSFSRQTCCWTCVTCKPNEVTTANASGCLPCPRFHWPDSLTRRRCEHIDAPMTPTDPLVALVLQVAAVVGLMVTLVTAFTFVLYRAQRVIRSSSRELSGVMLGGLASAYLLVFPLLSTPSPYTCYVTHLGFGLTFTLVYAPLVVKTHRIFRIFRAGRQSAALPRCTSCASQMAITSVLIAVQVVTVTISTALEPPEAELRQAVLTERVVERLCRLPLGGVVAALVYNMILVLVCTVLAFKTRRLPDNYNESRYIAFCVDTTLLVWLTFIPAYFTATLAAHKVLVLALALLLNSSVHLSCLFMPRLHALYRVMRGASTPNGDKQTFGSYGQIPLRVSSAVSMLTRTAASQQGMRETNRNTSASDVMESNCLHASDSDVMDAIALGSGENVPGGLQPCVVTVSDDGSIVVRSSQQRLDCEDLEGRDSRQVKKHASVNEVFDLDLEELPSTSDATKTRHSTSDVTKNTKRTAGGVAGSKLANDYDGVFVGPNDNISDVKMACDQSSKLNNGASLSSTANNCSVLSPACARTQTKTDTEKQRRRSDHKHKSPALVDRSKSVVS